MPKERSLASGQSAIVALFARLVNCVRTDWIDPANDCRPRAADFGGGASALPAQLAPMQIADHQGHAMVDAPCCEQMTV